MLRKYFYKREEGGGRWGIWRQGRRRVNTKPFLVPPDVWEEQLYWKVAKHLMSRGWMCFVTPGAPQHYQGGGNTQAAGKNPRPHRSPAWAGAIRSVSYLTTIDVVGMEKITWSLSDDICSESYLSQNWNISPNIPSRYEWMTSTITNWNITDGCRDLYILIHWGQARPVNLCENCNVDTEILMDRGPTQTTLRNTRHVSIC